jgi:hypothetical protein
LGVGGCDSESPFKKNDLEDAARRRRDGFRNHNKSGAAGQRLRKAAKKLSVKKEPMLAIQKSRKTQGRV